LNYFYYINAYTAQLLGGFDFAIYELFKWFWTIKIQIIAKFAIYSTWYS